MLRRDASAWLARLQSRRDPEVEEKFQRWRNRDPAHAEAFERVAASYQQAGLLRYSALASAPTGTVRPARVKTPAYAWAVAAALILIFSVAIYRTLGSGLWMSGTEAVMLSTRVGEIRSVSLSDGSKVILDTATRVEVEIGRLGRTALVKAGRARFAVAKAKRPFVIQAGSSIATAEGGVLDVEESGGEARIGVLAGSARVAESSTGSSGLRLAAGETTVSVQGHGLARQSLQSAPDWTRGMLEFDGTPLGTAVELANRYSTSKIYLSAGLDGLKVTGAFRAGDTKRLAAALAAAFHLTVARTSKGDLVLSRSVAT